MHKLELTELTELDVLLLWRHNYRGAGKANIAQIENNYGIFCNFGADFARLVLFRATSNQPLIGL